MSAFAALRALALAAAPPTPPPVILAVVDPLDLAIRRAIPGLDVTVSRHPDRITARAFLRDPYQFGDRNALAETAHAHRRTLAATIAAEGLQVRFTDALWCERGRRGWEIIARANPHPRPTAPDCPQLETANSKPGGRRGSE